MSPTRIPTEGRSKIIKSRSDITDFFHTSNILIRVMVIMLKAYILNYWKWLREMKISYTRYFATESSKMRLIIINKSIIIKITICIWKLHDLWFHVILHKIFIWLVSFISLISEPSVNNFRLFIPSKQSYINKWLTEIII